jgi:hypothetical protein
LNFGQLSSRDRSTAVADDACDGCQQDGETDGTETDPEWQTGFRYIVFNNGFSGGDRAVGWDGEFSGLTCSWVTAKTRPVETAFFDCTRETSDLASETNVVGGVTGKKTKKKKKKKNASLRLVVANVLLFCVIHTLS